MAGGKGGSQTTKVQIPKWLEDAAQQNLARANEVAQIGYTPYFGPDVAALSPMQQAGFANTGGAAAAFGLPGGGMTGMEGMPAPQTFAGGMQGYSAAPLYQQAVDALRTANPAQVAAIEGMFLNPQTGAAPAYPFGGATQNPAAPGGKGGGFAAGVPYSNSSGSDALGGVSGITGTGGAGFGGYTGLGDMVNGGGPGASGSTFSGGGALSGLANMAGISPLGSR